MSTSTILERSHLKAPEALAPTNLGEPSATVVAAAAQLGYRESQRRFEERARLATSAAKDQADRVKLGQLLVKCGIIPFTTDSVKSYKDAKVRANARSRRFAFSLAIPAYLLASGRATDSEIASKPVGSFALLTLLSAFCFGIAGLLIYGVLAAFGADVTLSIFYAGLVIGVATRLLRVVPWFARSADRVINDLAQRSAKFEWISSELSDYTGHVPERVLENALRLRDELGNEASFSVESFQRTEEPLQDPDPFLVLNYGGQKVYVDFWDEPEFAKTI